MTPAQAPEAVRVDLLTTCTKHLINYINILREGGGIGNVKPVGCHKGDYAKGDYTSKDIWSTRFEVAKI